MVAILDGLASSSERPDRREEVLLECYFFVSLLAGAEGYPLRETWNVPNGPEEALKPRTGNGVHVLGGVCPALKLITRGA